jgi:hypothetical protein
MRQCGPDPSFPGVPPLGPVGRPVPQQYPQVPLRPDRQRLGRDVTVTRPRPDPLPAGGDRVVAGQATQMRQPRVQAARPHGPVAGHLDVADGAADAVVGHRLQQRSGGPRLAVPAVQPFAGADPQHARDGVGRDPPCIARRVPVPRQGRPHTVGECEHVPDAVPVDHTVRAERDLEAAALGWCGVRPPAPVGVPGHRPRCVLAGPASDEQQPITRSGEAAVERREVGRIQTTDGSRGAGTIADGPHGDDRDHHEQEQGQQTDQLGAAP